MNSQAAVIANILRNAFPNGRAKVGLFFQADADVLERLLLEPHMTLVLGESFHPLNRSRLKAARNNGGRLRDNVLFLETRFTKLPISAHSFDALVLLGGLPQCAKTPSASLTYLRSLLTPKGLLVWPQPLDEGLFAGPARLRYPTTRERIGATKRTMLTRLAMEAGFIEIGQKAVQHNLIQRIITVGRASNRPWEQS
jgi:hypothetical protein